LDAPIAGADAHIGPAECTILTEIFGESVLPCKFRMQSVFTADIKNAAAYKSVVP
jgi:hypothetical protein